MFYFFHRDGVSLRCEVRDLEGDGYELVIDRPDKMIRVEQFGNPSGLNQRWSELERSLLREGWWGPQVLELQTGTGRSDQRDGEPGSGGTPSRGDAASLQEDPSGQEDPRR